MEPASLPLPARSSDERPCPCALHAHVRRALRLIRRRYREPLTLQDAADEIGVTREHLGTLFRLHTGRTFHERVVQMRVREAAQLLRRGVKAEAVARLVGYRSRRNFHRQFCRAFGMTPATYRAVADDAERWHSPHGR